MSSIYRKGRDGYYYYQAYVYNTETGKKDKRIFHSLGTREITKAEEKKIKLDIQYEKQALVKPEKSVFSFILNQRKSIVLISVTAVITIIIMKGLQNNVPSNNNIRPSVKSIENQLTSDKKGENYKDGLNVIKPEPVKPEPVKPEPVKPDPAKPDPVKSKPSIPKYNVDRVDRLSGAFDQGKVYVTVSKSTNYSSLIFLCKKLTKEYKEFSNIVICIYDNSAIGKDLANGIESNYSVEEQNKSWLAMYTYNPVEGEYFDDNPGAYLGDF